MRSGEAKPSEEAILRALLADVDASLDRYYRRDVSAYIDRFADDLAYLDWFSGGILGRAAAEEHMRGYADTIPPVEHEIVDARLRLVGEAAVLVMRLEMTDPTTGVAVAGVNATEVLRLDEGGWRIVHCHWAWDPSYGQAPSLET